MSVPESVPCTGAAATPMVSVTSRSSPATRDAGGGGLAQPPGGPLGGRQGQAGQEDGELLALHPRQQRLRRGVLAQQPGGDQQQFVAGRVPERVGDLGVVAECGQDQPGAGADRVRGEELVDLGGQALAVGQPGQPVVVGVVADLGEQLLVPDRRVDVGEHRVQRGAVAVGEGDDVAAAVADLEVARLPRGGHHRRAQQVGHAAARQGGGLLVVRARERDEQRALVGGHRAAAEDVVGVAGAVVPDRAVLGGDDQAGFLVEVGRQPERHPLGVEQLADRLRRSARCPPRPGRPAPRGGRSRRRARRCCPRGRPSRTAGTAAPTTVNTGTTRSQAQELS